MSGRPSDPPNVGYVSKIVFTRRGEVGTVAPMDGVVRCGGRVLHSAALASSLATRATRSGLDSMSLANDPAVAPPPGWQQGQGIDRRARTATACAGSRFHGGA